MQIILTDAHIEIDSVVYSGNNTNVALSMSAEALDITAMGDGTRKNSGGLLEWGMALEFNADEEVTGQTFFEMVGQTVPVKVRPSSAAIGVANPSYEGDAVITEYNPLEGAVGDAHKVSLTLVSAGELQRVTVAA